MASPSLHRALRLARLFHGESQKELAAAIGLSTSHLSELESGKKTATLAVLSRYAEHYAMPVSSFLLFLENSQGYQGVERAKQLVAAKTLKMLEWVADRTGVSADDQHERNRRVDRSDESSSTPNGDEAA